MFLESLHYMSVRNGKDMRSCLQDSGRIGKFSVPQPSMAREFTGRTSKLKEKNSPTSTLYPQEAGSEISPWIAWSPECRANDNKQPSDVSVSRFLQRNISFQGPEILYKAFQNFIGNSSDGTLPIDNSPSVKSLISSQTHPCYPQHFLVLGVPSGSAIGQHNGNGASLIECGNVDSCTLEVLSEDHDFSGKLQQRSHNIECKGIGSTSTRMENKLFSSKNTAINTKQSFKIPQGDIQQLLIECAEAVADYDFAMAKGLIARLRQVVSIWGSPIQRLGAYMTEGLEARLGSTGANLYKRLKNKEPDSAEAVSYFQILNAACPCFKFGYVAANGAIAEAFKDKDRIHIVDFHIAEGSQWVTLIQALARRDASPPHVRITGVEDPESEYARNGRLQLVGQRLSKLAESCNVPFEFHALPLLDSDVQDHMLGVRDGETLAVNFAFHLHHIPDESVSTSNHRDRVLQMIKRLDPKVVTLVEQESNTNTAPFFARFKETLNYYSAVFESLNVCLPRDSKDRVDIEENCLARNIVNIIACEDAERVVRHEVFGKWRSRFTMAGFRPCPLNSHVNLTIRTLCARYCENYRVIEKDEALYLGWLEKPLIAVSAWH